MWIVAGMAGSTPALAEPSPPSAGSEEPPQTTPAEDPSTSEERVGTSRWSADLEGPVRQVFAAPEGRVVVVGPFDVWLLDGSNGRVLDRLDRSSLDASLEVGAVWLCGVDGVRRIQIRQSRLTMEDRVSDRPCEALSGPPAHDPCGDLFAVGRAGVTALPLCTEEERVARRQADPLPPASSGGSALADGALQDPEARAHDAASPPDEVGRVSVPPASREPRRRPDLAAELGMPERTLHRRFILRRCSVVASVQGSLSDVEESWQNVTTSHHTRVSPGLGVACDFELWGGLGWSIGLETAPWLTYTMRDATYPHALIGTVAVGWAPERGFVGAQLVGGGTLLGLGAVGRWQAFQTRGGILHGPELRVTAALYHQFVGSTSLGYTFSLGPGRPSR
ncbi:MAG: hypothetical protein EA397_04390 [Deltaproteobacteria bacterium]|nr:MAG: hypothetical protein EA397_04390 [Deltaproteobacteria bacterium]